MAKRQSTIADGQSPQQREQGEGREQQVYNSKDQALQCIGVITQQIEENTTMSPEDTEVGVCLGIFQRSSQRGGGHAADWAATTRRRMLLNKSANKGRRSAYE